MTTARLAGRPAAPPTHASAYWRAFDIVIVVLGLPLLLPLGAMLAVALAVTARAWPLARTLCLGQGGRLFFQYEFRTRPQRSGRRAAEPPTQPLARFLEWSHLASLPKLYNVLRGDLALIGPPAMTPDVFHRNPVEKQSLLSVRPGVISPAQLYFWDKRRLLKPEEWRAFYREHVLARQADIDLAYLHRRTLWKDFALLLRVGFSAVVGGRRMYALLMLRNRHYFVLDVLALALTPAVALALLHNGLRWPAGSLPALLLYTAVALPLKLAVFGGFRLYRRYWIYASINDMATIFGAVTLATAAVTLLAHAAYPWLAGRGLAVVGTLPLIDGLLTGAVVSGFRFGLRGLYHWHRSQQPTLGGRRILVVGAGEAGVLTVREMQANPRLGMEPVLFVDDDPAKVGTQIQGLPVLGTSADIPRLVALHRIQRIIIAIPSAPPSRLRDLMAICAETRVTTHNLPGMYELLAGHKTISKLPVFDINQLLRRDPVEMDFSSVADLVRGRTVLITGAGGSIGSELCRQVARFHPAALVLLGHGENSIFEIGLDLRLSFPSLAIHEVILDVRNAQRVLQVVRQHAPHLIFHAAAHKHVPYMEASVAEAITNNVLGTRNVLHAAEECGVQHFVLISTDKAIRPVNVMGATKRIAELLTQAAALRTGRPYLAVRFGNVLGSRGSVVPVFQRQIAAGGPITITHPDMTRYFMTIPEAVQLVLQAAALAGPGVIYTLDMGDPVRIVDLAEDLCRLSGLTVGRDIDIIYSGIRPGEKLSEELFLPHELTERTRHERIFKAVAAQAQPAQPLEAAVDRLVALAPIADDQALLEQIRHIVPDYRPFSELPPPALVRPPARAAGVPPQPSRAGASESMAFR